MDALSPGQAEVILGRGSFTESFPLFGYNLADYDALFEEKIELFVKLPDEPVTWRGNLHAPLRDTDVFPTTESGRLRTWVGRHSPGFVADTGEEAKELYWPYYRVMPGPHRRALRGWPRIRRQEFGPRVEHGPLYIGSPETVARRIARAVRALGVGRFGLIRDGRGAAGERPPAGGRAARQPGGPAGP